MNKKEIENIVESVFNENGLHSRTYRRAAIDCLIKYQNILQSLKESEQKRCIEGLKQFDCGTYNLNKKGKQGCINCVSYKPYQESEESYLKKIDPTYKRWVGKYKPGEGDYYENYNDSQNIGESGMTYAELYKMHVKQWKIANNIK